MAETIQDTTDRLTAFINNSYTDVDTGPGSVISELLLKLAAVVHNQQYTIISNLSQSNAITKALTSTADTYSPAIDLIASNYNTTRNPGAKSKGKVKVTINSGVRVTVPAGFTFTQPVLNLTYVVSATTKISLTPSEALGEQQLYNEGGLYYFFVDVEATEAGEAYQLNSEVALVPTTGLSIVNFVKAEAYGNFSTGIAVDTDKQLIEKIKYNLGNSRFVSPIGISNRFKSIFPAFQTLSVCGANDPEMTRSKQNILGISTFGKADVYVRSGLGPETLQIVKTAKKVATGLWQMYIRNYDAPGFYHVKSILPSSVARTVGGTLAINKILFGASIYPEQRNNEIFSDTDARFTKYQTAEIIFEYLDPENSAVGTETSFDVLVTCQPNIAAMQDLLLLDAERLACADYLIKAVIPCVVSLKINLLKKHSTDTFDTLNLQQLKKDLFTYINTIPFGKELHASTIVDICHNYNIKRVDLPIDMRGDILCPDGTTISLQDSDVLTIPTNLAKGVTPNTTLYFIDYYRIDQGAANPIDNIGLNLA